MESFEETVNGNSIKYHVAYVSAVRNMAAVREALADGSLPLSVLKTSAAPGLFAIHMAILRSNISFADGSHKTRNLNTEILYNLSPSRQIKQALETFGATESDTEVVVIAHGNVEEAKKSIAFVQGTLQPLESLTFAGQETLQKTYAIKAAEQASFPIEDNIVTHIAMKHAK